MSNFIKKIISSVNRNNNSENINNNQCQKKKRTSISKSIEENRQYIESYFSYCFDLVMREISFFNINGKKTLVVYLEGLSEKKLIEDFLISKLTSEINVNNMSLNEEELLKYRLGIKDTEIYEDIEKSIEAILSGNPVVFVNDLEKSFEINLNTSLGRQIDEPSTEVVTRGPREGFTESLITNINLIRKKIKNSNLKMEKFKVGKETNTNVVISYLSSVADKKIVNEVKERLKNIDIESVLDSNYIEEYISDAPLSIFPLVFRTEKPDIAAAKILEGRIIIIVDGSPVVLSAPALFVEFLQSGEDYYIRFSSATLNRCIRFISLIITITLPSIYIALVTFHQELIPTKLILSVISARANVPLPAMWESIFMLTAFEIMREAGIRMPKSFGQAISIVGGLVLGDAAVKAGIVGTPMVVIVALTAITKFTIPSVELELPIVYIRFFFLLLSGFLGLTGLTCGILLVSMRLVSIRSFGVPYMFPICPFSISLGEDEIIRAPMWKLNKTQRLLKLKNNFISNRIHKHSR
jgi:Bacillus/Clostridium GerA spore germination protein.